MKYLMTQLGTISVTGEPPLITGGIFTITSPPSAGVSIEGKPIYSGPLKYTFAGGSSAGFVPASIVSVGEQVINPTLSKVLVDGKLVVRVDDVGLMLATGALTGGGTGPISAPVAVTDAGQESVAA
jgi:hypothetical protein